MGSTNTLPLDQWPLTALKGVGSRLAAILSKLNLTTVQDLLFHLPSRYMDRTRIVPLDQVTAGAHVVVQGVIASCDVVQGRRRSLYAVIRDPGGQIGLRFFHFTAAQKAQLAPGTLLRCYGEIRLGATGLELYHPEYEFPASASVQPLPQNLTPVYPLTDGLSQTRLRKLTEQALGFLETHPPAELLPREFNLRFGGHSLSDALQYVHFPPRQANIDELTAGAHPCQLRLAFEELLAHHFALQQHRLAAQAETAPRLLPDPKILAQLYRGLPFTLTRAQQRVIDEIFSDLQQSKPMLRLVQGDVGSGKTLVAAAAALGALSNGFQVAVVAPTEILAEQHFLNFNAWLEPLGFTVDRLMGKLTPTRKQAAQARIAEGSVDVAVGTHALFEQAVSFARLGLIIIDEQHRFGVHQRLSLRQKAETVSKPHQLVMTATPIPRTLAMTWYADLDLSVIDELPPGRTPINTVLVSQRRRDQVIERVRHACSGGHQVYWVCTLIEDSETLSARAAQVTAEELHTALPGISVGLIHGRLKSQQKEAMMAEFKAGSLRLLVATTVIEVGVDVPNASLMIIENPERLGLAQLHQLRGRVGRGTAASHCVLLYSEPLSAVARQRLSALRQSSDGFVIAEEDLRIRGPGELLGVRQTGELMLRLADIQKHSNLLPAVQKAAPVLMQRNPDAARLLMLRWFPRHSEYLRG